MPGLDCVQEGFKLHVEQDVLKSNNYVSSLMMQFFDTVAGDCGKSDKNALSELVCITTNDPVKMRNMPLEIPLTDDDALTFDYYFPSEHGVLVSDPGAYPEARWKSFRVGVTVQVGAGDAGLVLSAEAVLLLQFAGRGDRKSVV